MKKRLEGELISIAHRILKLKSKSEIDQLYKETQKLYETLAILKFYGDNFEQLKSSISIEKLEAKIEKANESKEVDAIEEVTSSNDSKIFETTKEDKAIEETVFEVETADVAKETDPIEIEDEIAEEPIIVGSIELDEDDLDENEAVDATLEENNEEEILEFETKNELEFEPQFEEVAKPPIQEVVNSKQQISFEDLLGPNYLEPVFVKPNEIAVPTQKSEVVVEKTEPKSLSLNDTLSKSITIGLNDRIGFVNYLFDENVEDYNRVLSQLNTFSNFSEAKDFIEEIIKPDYNNWAGKEDYEARFIEIVEKKFL